MEVLLASLGLLSILIALVVGIRVWFTERELLEFLQAFIATFLVIIVSYFFIGTTAFMILVIIAHI